MSKGNRTCPSGLPALVSLAGQSAIIAHHLIVGAADRGIACGVTVEDIV
jgi:hypothetical protein